MGGAALHLGNIAEMKTGEGKTLVATLPAYLNALAGKGVHVVTVNDYLAERDVRVDGPGPPLPRPHGRRASSPSMTPAERRAQYACDITYGTNNEFGFDYLRDNMAWSQGGAGPARPQLRDRRRGRLDPHRRGPHAADHHRPGRRRPTKWYAEFAKLVPQRLRRDDVDYEVDEKKRTVGILEPGVEKVED